MVFPVLSDKKRAVAFLWCLTGLFRGVLHHGVSGCRCVCLGAMRFLRQYHQIGVLLLVVLVNRYPAPLWVRFGKKIILR